MCIIHFFTCNKFLLAFIISHFYHFEIGYISVRPGRCKSVHVNYHNKFFIALI